ncbi:MAG: hypothetical protein AAF385_02280 [Pseudomonadota bacterium]
MWKSLGLIVIGFVSGALVATILLEFTQTLNSPFSQPFAVDDTSKLSHADLEIARGTGFEDVNGIEDIVAFPTDFSRREALYVLAGRSDSDRLQKLISDAYRISERALRDSALSIFFRRFAELDPLSALALSRVDPYKKDEGLGRTVWRTWARNDLDQAILAANSESNRAYRADAAQSLYAAFGYMGNDKTQRIFQELGVEPNRQTRLRYARTLLEDSPRVTIEFISEEPSALRRNEYINWLAYALDTNDQSEAMSYTKYFSLASDRTHYSKLVESRFAQINPIETLQQALATKNVASNGDFQSALKELASQDITEAMKFYDQIQEPKAKMIGAFLIADELAGSDPEAALEWVRSLDEAQKQRVERAVLVRIAGSDPAFALGAAAALPDTQRASSTSQILLAVARTDPALAKNFLAALPEDSDRPRIHAKLGQAWLMQDPTEAIQWLETLDKRESSKIAATATRFLSRSQPEASYRLLGLLDEQQRPQTAKELVRRFAARGNVTKARALIDEFSAAEGFETIEAYYIGGLAKHDSATATQLAFQLSDDKERSTALSNIASAIVVDDPAEAAGLLQNIIEPKHRRNTIQTIARSWYRADQDAAVRWLTSLPTGEERDSAIVSAAMNFETMGQQELQLFEHVSDSKSREMAMRMSVLRLARKDKVAALQALKRMDMPEDQKEKLRETIRK